MYTYVCIYIYIYIYMCVCEYNYFCRWTAGQGLAQKECVCVSACVCVSQHTGMVMITDCDKCEFMHQCVVIIELNTWYSCTNNKRVRIGMYIVIQQLPGATQ